MTVSLSRRVIVLFGTPLVGVQEQAHRLAASGNGVYLGDLNLSMVDSVWQLLDLFALAQTPQHEALFEALHRHVPEARDPSAFLSEHRQWTIGELLDSLLGAVQAPLITITDVMAGFRIHHVDRWFEWIPDAAFVHVTSPPAEFIAVAAATYRSKLYVPPDYRDHGYEFTAPLLKPELAWFQVHTTLARSFTEATTVARCRIDRAALSRLVFNDISALIERQAHTGDIEWPFALCQHRALNPSLPALVHSLGY